MQAGYLRPSGHNGNLGMIRRPRSVMEPVLQLNRYLPWVRKMGAPKRVAVIEQKAMVGQVQSRQPECPVLSK